MSFFYAQRHTNPFILILSNFSCLVTFHFWWCPFSILLNQFFILQILMLCILLSICHAILVFDANFDYGFSEPVKKLLDPRIIKIEYLEAPMSFHLEFFKSTLELMKFQQGFFDPSKCWFVPHTVLLPLYSKVCIYWTHFFRTMYLVKFLNSAQVLYG